MFPRRLDPPYRWILFGCSSRAGQQRHEPVDVVLVPGGHPRKVDLLEVSCHPSAPSFVDRAVTLRRGGWVSTSRRRR
jgi:hypothetical protein